MFTLQWYKFKGVLSRNNCHIERPSYRRSGTYSRGVRKHDCILFLRVYDQLQQPVEHNIQYNATYEKISVLRKLLRVKLSYESDDYDDSSHKQPYVTHPHIFHISATGNDLSYRFI